MALFIQSMKCILCGKPMDDCDDVVMFPAFIPNKADPLFHFSDAAMHKDCFSNESLHTNAIELLNEYQQKMSHVNRTCDICKGKILSQNDFVSFSCLSSDKSQPLSDFNFKQYHESCLLKNNIDIVVKELCVIAEKEGKWKGDLVI